MIRWYAIFSFSVLINISVWYKLYAPFWSMCIRLTRFVDLYDVFLQRINFSSKSFFPLFTDISMYLSYISFAMFSCIYFAYFIWIFGHIHNEISESCKKSFIYLSYVCSNMGFFEDILHSSFVKTASVIQSNTTIQEIF